MNKAKASRSFQNDLSPPIPLITTRERQTLILISQEYTNNEIAQLMFISHETVKTYRCNLLAKLNCRNTAGLVMKGIQAGIIKF